MKDPKRTALKRLKRRRKVAARRKHEQEILRSGKIIMFGTNRVVMKRDKPKSPKKPKVAKVLKPYLAVKLTAKLDQLTAQIRGMDPNDPKLASLKQRRDVIKRRLSIKK